MRNVCVCVKVLDEEENADKQLRNICEECVCLCVSECEGAG